MSTDAPAIACTLKLHEMGPRLERLRQLADNSLQWHKLEGNVLRLAYRADAAAEVKAVVDLKRNCCRFLDFAVQDGAIRVELTITAPVDVGPDAQWLLAQFMPTGGAKTQPHACCASCDLP